MHNESRVVHSCLFATAYLVWIQFNEVTLIQYSKQIIADVSNILY